MWRETVFRRDNHTCILCGTRGSRLNAHHIRPWAKYPEYRFDISNGLTCCDKCHRLIHREKPREYLVNDHNEAQLVHG